MQTKSIEVDARRWAELCSKLGLDPLKATGDEFLAAVESKATGTVGTVLEMSTREILHHASPAMRDLIARHGGDSVFTAQHDEQARKNGEARGRKFNPPTPAGA